MHFTHSLLKNVKAKKQKEQFTFVIIYEFCVYEKIFLTKSYMSIFYLCKEYENIVPITIMFY